MRIFVAGATGAIGRRLLPLLLAEGHEVIGLSRRPASSGADPVRWRVADVYDRAALEKVLLEERPEVVMHQLTDLSERNFAANGRMRMEGTRNLVDAALKAGVGSIVAQSIAWAYEPGEGAATEATALDVHADLPRRTTIEGVVALETAVAELPRAVILRYGILYGPGTWYARDGLVAQQVMRREMNASPEVTNFLHVDDAARAAVRALEWPSGVVNVVDDQPAAAMVWLSAFARELGAPAPVVVETPGPAWARAVSNRYARSLGWEPVHPSWTCGFF